MLYPIEGARTFDLFAPRDSAIACAEAEKRSLIALSLIPGVGATRARNLVSSLGSATAVRESPAHFIAGIRGIGAPLAHSISAFDAEAAVDRQLDLAERVGARFVALGDREYPALLQRIYDPPPFLWVRGAVSEQDAHAIAVVGTRRASDYGRRAAAHFGRGLAESGITVVSGLAYGIDIEAHKGALDGGGRTIAVLGSGVDRIYPARHAGLVRRILEEGRGAVISEVPMGRDPARGAFPSRNRIVSGLSTGTLVVESRERGGALLTAAMALDQNREVFAVPAPMFSAATGTNRLIQRGCAALVTDVIDITEVVGAPSGEAAERTSVEPSKSEVPELNQLERRLFEALTPTPQTLDTICAVSGLDTSTTLVYLLQLEFKGLVRQLAGKQFFVAP